MSKKYFRIVSLSAVLLIVVWAAVGIGEKSLSAAEQNQPSEPAQDAGSVLNLYNPGIQLMSYSSDTGIYQHVYNAGVGYHTAWQSAPLTMTGYPNAIVAVIRIGDINNDGIKEVVASGYGSRSVRNKGTVTSYYNFKIFVYKDGCAYGSQPDPLLSSGPLGEMTSTIINDCFIADVDNLASPGIPHNELVLLRSREVDVCRLNAGDNTWTLEKIGTVSQYNFSLDVRDADNDGKNEIVVSSTDGPYPVIFKYNGSGWDRSTLNPASSTSVQVISAKVRDADNMSLITGKLDNEIIARGDNGGLVVWKFDRTSGTYEVQFVGGNFAAGNVVDAGHISDFVKNDVLLIGMGTGKKPSPTIFRYLYDPNAGTYALVGTSPSPVQANNMDFVMGDLDGDGLDEVAILTFGTGGFLKVLKFSGADFQTVYSPPTVFTGGKLEIR